MADDIFSSLSSRSSSCLPSSTNHTGAHLVTPTPGQHKLLPRNNLGRVSSLQVWRREKWVKGVTLATGGVGVWPAFELPSEFQFFSGQHIFI